MKPKSLLSLLFIFTLLFSLPLPAAAEEAAEEYTSADGNYRYILENETVTITYIEKSALERENDELFSDYLLNIPAAIDGYPVKKIGDNVGAGDYLYKPSQLWLGIKLSISDGIEYIGNGAFKGAWILQLSLPNTLLTIGDDAFSHTFFMSISLPESLVSVGDYAFSYRSGPEALHPMFLTIPKNLTHIGEGAFSNCSYLKNITVDPENPVYHSDGNCLIETATKTLRVGSYVSTIPSDGSVTTIDDYAFSCAYVELGRDITIPRSIIKIGKDNFDEARIYHSPLILQYEGSATEWHAVEVAEGNDGYEVQFLGQDPPTTTEPSTTTVPTTTAPTTAAPTTTTKAPTTTTTKVPTTTTTTKTPTTTKSTTTKSTTTTITTKAPTTTVTDVVTTTDAAATTTADVAAATPTTTDTTTTATTAANTTPKGQFPWWVLLIAIPVAAAGVGVTIVVLKKRRSDA